MKFELPPGIPTVMEVLSSDGLCVTDTVRLRKDRIYSGIEFMPSDWYSAGGGSEEARVIAITDYHTPYYGYTGMNNSMISRKVEVMFPNGGRLELPWVGQFEIIDNGDPLL